MGASGGFLDLRNKEEIEAAILSEILSRKEEKGKKIEHSRFDNSHEPFWVYHAGQVYQDTFIGLLLTQLSTKNNILMADILYKRGGLLPLPINNRAKYKTIEAYLEHFIFSPRDLYIALKKDALKKTPEFLNLKDEKGRTILHHAALQAHKLDPRAADSILYLLFRENIHFSVQDNDGNTPFHLVRGKKIEDRFYNEADTFNHAFVNDYSATVFRPFMEKKQECMTESFFQSLFMKEKLTLYYYRHGLQRSFDFLQKNKAGRNPRAEREYYKEELQLKKAKEREEREKKDVQRNPLFFSPPMDTKPRITDHSNGKSYKKS